MLGPILWDFGAHTLTFRRQGRQICWHRVAGPAPSGLFAASANAALLDALLHAFDAVFAEPCALPPPRSRGHSIVLLPGSQPVAVWPYRYPALHKDELERQCAAMLS